MSDGNRQPLRPLEEIFPLLAKKAAQQQPKDVASLTTAHEGRIALLVIDVQRQFCALEERGTYETIDIAERIQSIVPAFRAASVPVYAVYANAAHEHDFFKFIPEESDTLVVKSYNSAFKATNLRELLEQDDKKLLLVCGFNKTACVKETLLDARKAGFDVCLLEDLSGDDSFCTDSARDYAAQEFKYSGAVLTTARDVLRHL